ncbi:serine protease family S10 [Thraustotheca clavata]|uniref:Carboxypeptidase n=1 Tax=Thraustotheca clavata TaxID=74557 RepID=A0A1V9ZZG7_9STRA|nr:serine protease family S10 [Thraustotheca clavata]
MAIWTSLIVAALGVFTASAENPHKINSLPNYADDQDINFNQFAGQVPLPSNGQKMFYWLVESQTTPSSDPLVLWLNGGPGCSSLGGFFTELGPFVVDSELKVKRNPYGWNRKANVVFLESPAGVGFSGPLLNGTNYNDDFTTARVYEFLEQFLKLYPAYAKRDFYITGESYAGMYIPWLANALVTKPIPNLSLKGFAIGNAYTDTEIDDTSVIDYYYNHAMISVEAYKAINAGCTSRNVTHACMNNATSCPSQCGKPLNEALDSIQDNALDPYYIYGDVCYLLEGATQKELNIRSMNRGVYGPCRDVYTQDYLRLPQVQEAIHVESGYVNWTDCNDDVSNIYHGSNSSLPKYPAILAAGLNVLIYSGDADTVVNFLGTQRWITSEGLNLKVQDKWKAWFGPDKQLAGYTERYTNLTFTTIKGAGHMVPSVRPLHALHMFECFLYGASACKNFTYPEDELEYITGAAPNFGTFIANYWPWVFAAIVIVSLLIAYGVYSKYSQKYTDKKKYTELKAVVQPGYGN